MGDSVGHGQGGRGEFFGIAERASGDGEPTRGLGVWLARGSGPKSAYQVKVRYSRSAYAVRYAHLRR